MRPIILAIDDSKMVRTLVKKALAAFACEVHEATNGFTGLFAMERALPDLLLIDASMTIMDGVEMLVMLKSNPQLKTIPVIMLTSPTDHKILPKITALGINGVVMKPFTDATLVEAICAVLPLKAVKAPKAAN